MRPRRTLTLLLLIMAAGAVFAAAVLYEYYLQLDVQQVRLASSGEQRSYLVHVPDGLDETQAVPLVIAIHGYSGWPAQMALTSGWNKVADREGFIVVYPRGTGMPLHWRAGGAWADDDDPLVDVRFISTVIDDVSQRYKIDPQRVYVNGHSNGGGMSYLLSCALSDRFAAVGSVSGAYMLPDEACQPERVLPMITFHGTADPIVPFEGGPSDMFDVPFVVVPDWMDKRAAKMGCSDAVVDSVLEGVTRKTYSVCRDDAELVFYTMDGVGHVWPGGRGLPTVLTGPNTDIINVTEMMWTFFEKYAGGGD